MDGKATTMSEIRHNFRTPLRILLPKLLQSRDGWKGKSDRRKAQLKAAKIKIRDCSASRDQWRQRAQELSEDTRQWRQRAERAERELEQLRARVSELEEKKRS
jgi:chromosome segregation ATPase